MAIIDYIYIVKSMTDEENIYLSKYTSSFKSQLVTEILNEAWERDKFKGTIQERLDQLGWKIVKCKLTEIEE